MRALVTGATGFIGSHVVSSLVERGWEISALVLPGDEARLDRRVAAIAADMHSFGEVEAAIMNVRPQVAVHLAWYVKPVDYLASRENTKMLASSVRLAEILLDAGCKEIVGVGTGVEYDTTLPDPYSETS